MRPAPATVQALTLLATHEEPQVRISVARLLSNVAAQNGAAHAACRDMMRDLDSNVRCNAALGLARSGDFSRPVWEALAHFNSAAAGIYETVGDFIRTIPQAAAEELTAAAASTVGASLRTRLGLVALVGMLAPAKDYAVSVLYTLLDDENSRIKLEAADLLRTLVPAGERIPAVLVSLLDDDDRFIRRTAAERLLKVLRRDQTPAVATLLALLDDTEYWSRQSALWELTQLAHADDSVVSALRQTLASADAHMRFNAAALLNQAGNVSEDVVDALTQALDDHAPWIRLTAAHVLEASGYPSIRTSKISDELLRDPDPRTRFQASLFHEVRKKSRPLEQILDDMANDHNCPARDEARDMRDRLKDYGRLGADFLFASSDALLQAEGIRTLDSLRGMGMVLNGLPGAGFPAYTTWKECIESVAIAAGANSAETLATLLRVIDGEALSRQDGVMLGSIIQIDKDDTESQSQAKRWLAQWLWHKLEPGSWSSPGYVRYYGSSPSNPFAHDKRWLHY